MEIKMQKHIVDSQKIKQRKSEHTTTENHQFTEHHSKRKKRKRKKGELQNRK